jgi:hypothetical protein
MKFNLPINLILKDGIEIEKLKNKMAQKNNLS